MVARILALGACIAMCGCIQLPLKRNMVRQSATIAEIEQQQVIDNLAQFCVNANGLPHFAFPNSGATQISGTANGGMLFNYSRVAFTGWNFNFGGSASEQANWVLQPVNDPGRLRRMRCAFQIEVGAYPLPPKIGCEDDCYKTLSVFKQMGLLKEDSCSCVPMCGDKPSTEACNKVLELCQDGKPPSDEYFESLKCNFPTGWFYCGNAHDVPSNACYVGSCSGRYVWVTPSGMDAFTRFTLTIITLATTDPPGPEADVERELDDQGKVTGFKIKTRENVRMSKIPDTRMHAGSETEKGKGNQPQVWHVEPQGPISEPRRYIPFDPAPSIIQLQSPIR